MFYRKPLRGKPTKTKVLNGQFVGGIESVAEQLFLPQRVSSISYNVSGKSGALKHRWGFEHFDEAELPQASNLAIKRIWYLSNDKISHFVAFASDNRLYFIDQKSHNKQWQQVEGGVEFLQTPVAVAYKLVDTNVLFLSSPKDGMYYYDGCLFEVADAPCLTSMAVHYERLFGVSGSDNILWFSDDLNPTNWNISLDEAGFIELADDKGKLLKVVSFLDYLYLFRENGITRISAYAEQTDFNVTQLYVSSGKIFGDTVEVCGDIILFLTEDGLFSFNGQDTKKLLSNLDSFYLGQDNSNAVSAYVRGKYILLWRLNFNDNKRVGCEGGSYTNNSMLTFDLYSGEQTLVRGVDGCFVCRSEFNSKPLVCFNGKYSHNVATLCDNGSCFCESLEKNWTAPLTDFGASYSDKIVNYVVLYSAYDITLTATVDGQIFTFEISGKSHCQKIPLNLKGRLFCFCYSTEAKQMYVVDPKFVYTQVGGGL